MDELAERLPPAFRSAADDTALKALGADLPKRLADRVADPAEKCRRALEAR